MGYDCLDNSFCSLPHPPPSTPTPVMAQPSGFSSNGSMYPSASANNGGVSIMPAAGHYADMQTLMASMDSLASWLQQNREEWASLQEGLARVERVQARRDNDGGTDGPMDGDPASAPASAPTTEDDIPNIPSLHSALSAAYVRITALESQLSSHETLQALYEATLTDSTDRIRQYCFEQQNYTSAIHRHYAHLLQQSREEVVEAQIVHQGWQEGLQRLSGMVRKAYAAREEERRPWLGELRGLRDENRMLRGMVGWKVAPVDSEGDDEEEEEGFGMGRGRVGFDEEEEETMQSMAS